MFKRGKYGARKVKEDGITFDSAAEYHRYKELRQMEAAGEIRDLEVHPRFNILMPFTDFRGKKHRGIDYVADFMYWDCQEDKPWVEDVKGMKTDVYKIKIKLFLSFFRSLSFREVRVCRGKTLLEVFGD